MDGINQPTTVQPLPKRFSKYDVVTLKSDGSKKIVLRKDGSLKYDSTTDKFSTSKGDEWFEHSDEIIQKLEDFYKRHGYIEL